MRGLTIGALHTYKSLGMILAKPELSAAPIKQKKIDIEGGHGSIDLTEFFGYPQYDDVTHKFTFAILGDDLTGQYNRIKNALHGVKATATTEGSLITMPLPLTKTRVFAVPRSIPISCVNNILFSSRKTISEQIRLC